MTFIPIIENLFENINTKVWMGALCRLKGTITNFISLTALASYIRGAFHLSKLKNIRIIAKNI